MKLVKLLIFILIAIFAISPLWLLIRIFEPYHIPVTFTGVVWLIFTLIISMSWLSIIAYNFDSWFDSKFKK